MGERERTGDPAVQIVAPANQTLRLKSEITMDPRILRIQELFRQMDQITAEIAAMLVPVAGGDRINKTMNTSIAKPRGHACCGSKIRRHKKICTAKDSAPADGKMRNYACTDCDHKFQDERDYEAQLCPECDSPDVIQKH